MNIKWRSSVLALVAVMCVANSWGQQETRKVRKNRSVTVVTTNDGKDSARKVTVVVDGDNVTINGKPASEYKGDDVQVITDSHIAIPGMAWSRGRGATAPRAIAGDVFSWNSNAAVLGVSTATVDENNGAKITDISKESAAEKAGLKEGDIITKVNDQKIEEAEDLTDAIGKYKPDEKITITYKRDGKEQTATATLQKNKKSFGQAFSFGGDNNVFEWNGSRAFAGFGRPRLGLQIEDLEEGSGVKVLDVDEETPAGKAGLKKDDIITSFNGKDIKDVDDLREAMDDVETGETIKVSFKRGGSTQNAEIKFPKPVKKARL